MIDNFIAHIDGSHHYKSKSSGWGFIVYKDNVIFQESFGEVPDKFNNKFEEYACSQLLKFITISNIKKIQIYTDALNVKNIIEKSKFLEQEFLKYDSEISLKEIDLSIHWISSKENGIADKLSRRYLEKYFYREKEKFKENFKKGIVNGNIKHPKINYFHDSRLLHSVAINARTKQRNFLTAVKFSSIIIEVGEFRGLKKEKGKIIRVLKANEKSDINKFEVLEVQELQKYYLPQILDLSNKWLDFNKRILLCLSLKDNIFEELTSLKKSTQSNEFHEHFNDLLEKMVEFVIHDKLMLKENSTLLPKTKKKTLDTQTKINKIKDKMKKKIDNSSLGKLLRLEIGKFNKINDRMPNKLEKEEIISHIKKDFSCDLLDKIRF